MCFLVQDPGQVRVRRGAGDAWSVATLNMQLSRQPGRQELLCKTTSTSHPFMCSLCSLTPTLGSALRIVEPLSFKNSLPVGVIFGLCRSASEVPYSYVGIPPGTTTGEAQNSERR